MVAKHKRGVRGMESTFTKSPHWLTTVFVISALLGLLGILAVRENRAITLRAAAQTERDAVGDKLIDVQHQLSDVQGDLGAARRELVTVYAQLAAERSKETPTRHVSDAHPPIFSRGFSVARP